VLRFLLSFRGVCQAALLIKCPGSILARRAWDDLVRAVDLLEMASKEGVLAQELYPRLRRIQDQARVKLLAHQNGISHEAAAAMVPSLSPGHPFAAVGSTDDGENIMLGAVTRLSRKLSSSHSHSPSTSSHSMADLDEAPAAAAGRKSTRTGGGQLSRVKSATESPPVPSVLPEPEFDATRYSISHDDLDPKVLEMVLTADPSILQAVSVSPEIEGQPRTFVNPGISNASYFPPGSVPAPPPHGIEFSPTSIHPLDQQQPGLPPQFPPSGNPVPYSTAENTRLSPGFTIMRGRPSSERRSPSSSRAPTPRSQFQPYASPHLSPPHVAPPPQSQPGPPPYPTMGSSGQAQYNFDVGQFMDYMPLNASPGSGAAPETGLGPGFYDDILETIDQPDNASLLQSLGLGGAGPSSWAWPAWSTGEGAGPSPTWEVNPAQPIMNPVPPPLWLS
jgi:hypothetical protein